MFKTLEPKEIKGILKNKSPFILFMVQSNEVKIGEYLSGENIRFPVGNTWIIHHQHSQKKPPRLIQKPISLCYRWRSSWKSHDLSLRKHPGCLATICVVPPPSSSAPPDVEFRSYTCNIKYIVL